MRYEDGVPVPDDVAEERPAPTQPCAESRILPACRSPRLPLAFPIAEAMRNSSSTALAVLAVILSWLR
jgi:hypothetical protein